ncbi:MAG: hypothetical protein JHD16_01375 [Solirubrobacteraceae bacterium]|nr:hypothetical protein [Solirubrobacteraceae bacterium]
MSTRLEQVADGLLALAGDRLSPDGVDLPRHYLRAARALAETEFAAHQVSGADRLAGDDVLRAGGDASYTAMEAAGTLWTLAVRLRARCKGLHVDEAAAPLREALMEQAGEGGDHDPGQAGLDAAARSLVLASFVVDIATDNPLALREAAFVDPAVHQIVSHGVLNLLRLSVAFQEDAGLS